MRGKAQNVVYLTGWIIDHQWSVERLSDKLSGFVLHCTVRTDREFFGGHHNVLILNDLGMNINACLHVFENERDRPDDIESVPFNELGEHFLEVSVTGWLRGNDVIATEVRCLNVTAEQRHEAREMLKAMKAAGALQPAPRMA